MVSPALRNLVDSLGLRCVLNQLAVLCEERFAERDGVFLCKENGERFNITDADLITTANNLREGNLF